MPYEIQRCRQGYYWISYSGPVDLELRLGALYTVEAYSREIPIKGNLIDFRNADLHCSFTEQFSFATKATEQSGHLGRKAAYLVRQEHAAAIEILELAMCNRGIETRLFTDEADAIRWLTDECYHSCEEFRLDNCPLGVKTTAGTGDLVSTSP